MNQPPTTPLYYAALLHCAALSLCVGSLVHAQTSATDTTQTTTPPTQPEQAPFDPLPGQLMLDTKHTHTLPVQGPYAGPISALALADTQDSTRVFALTPRGVYAYNDPLDRWEHTPYPNPPNPESQPTTTDLGLYLGHRSDRSPHTFDFAATDRSLLVRQPDGQVLQRSWTPAPSSWTQANAFKDPSIQFVASSTVSAFLTRNDTPDAPCSIWSQDRNGSSWFSQTLETTCAPLTDTTPQRGASWRDLNVVPVSDSKPVGVFVPIDAQNVPNPGAAFPWRTVLEKTRDRTVRSRCAQATGMLRVESAKQREATTWVAVGPRTVCVSTDNGQSFDVRDTLFQSAQRGDLVAPLTSVVAFPWRSASSGVRILAATRGLFRTKAPASRSFGGRLFASDDQGTSWREITPDINAPGSFLQLEARMSPDDRPEGPRVEVWLLTERRGAWKLHLGGLDLDPATAGLDAQWIHQLGGVRSEGETLHAVGPAGAFRSGTPWSQTSYVSARALGIRDTTAQNTTSQLWIGTYRGQVLFRPPKGSAFSETIPLHEEPRSIYSTSHSLSPWSIPPDSCLTCRAVSYLVPTGIRTVVERGTNPEYGYALVDGEGIAQRGWDGWVWLDLPSEARNIRVLGMTRAPTADSDRTGIVVLVHEQSNPKDPASGVFALWLHRSIPNASEGSWKRFELPSEHKPIALFTTINKVFISTQRPSIETYTIQQGTISKTHSSQTPHPCHLLIPRTDDGATCISNNPTPTPLPEFSPTRVLVAHTLTLDSDALRNPPKTFSTSKPLVLDLKHPNERAAIHTAMHTRNAVGEQLWVSTGIGIHATVQALYPEKPPTESPTPTTPQDALPFWKTGFFWTLVALSLLILVPAVILISRRIKTIYKRNDGIDDDPLRDDDTPEPTEPSDKNSRPEDS